MSTAPHHNQDDNDDNNQDPNHRDDKRARIENAAQVRVPVATIRYWRNHGRWRPE